jgi:hypothetical protein
VVEVHHHHVLILQHIMWASWNHYIKGFRVTLLWLSGVKNVVVSYDTVTAQGPLAQPQ